jgi:hypothetical protein
MYTSYVPRVSRSETGATTLAIEWFAFYSALFGACRDKARKRNESSSQLYSRRNLLNEKQKQQSGVPRRATSGQVPFRQYIAASNAGQSAGSQRNL